ncbi:nucleotidyltransferase family protein [Wolinella succinogenes]|uniref:nucleotidyltransferase family protein n=1 Tax=Wolinella succinogenes TaxID=844 RepID=UPI002408F94B|nr:nucleotidyltransferase domain-containing protein [Wolinella succinogenes]
MIQNQTTTLNSIVMTIKQLKPELQEKFGITQLALFGSYAKGEVKDESDVDIAIISMNIKNGFLIAKAKRFLSEKLQKEVDIGLLDSIRPFVRKRIEKDLLYV